MKSLEYVHIQMHISSKEISEKLPKIISYKEAVDMIATLRSEGKTVVFAQGVFDILHDGHVQFLREAKSKGDILIVGIENDAGVRKNKGQTRPLNSQEKRLDVLRELASVDYVFAFDDDLIYDEPGDEIAYIKRYNDLLPNFVAVSSWDPYLSQIQKRVEKAGTTIYPIDIKVADLSTTTIKNRL